VPLPFGAVSVGDARSPAAVIAHGSASTADFVIRVFENSVTSRGLRLVTWDRRSPPAEAVGELAALVEATDAIVVGGISIGALIAAHHAVAAHERLQGLLLALPPWLGEPDDIAALSATAASDIAGHGVATALQAMAVHAPSWVAAEVTEAWLRWAAPDDKALIAELHATATTVGPTATDLSHCTVPTGIATFDDDPLHPVSAARAWAAALPRAATVTLPRERAASDRGVIGAAAVAAWQQTLGGCTNS